MKIYEVTVDERTFPRMRALKSSGNADITYASKEIMGVEYHYFGNRSDAYACFRREYSRKIGGNVIPNNLFAVLVILALLLNGMSIVLGIIEG